MRKQRREPFDSAADVCCGSNAALALREDLGRFTSWKQKQRRGHETDERRDTGSPDRHFARLNTSSSVMPAGVRGFVNFNSSSVIDVTIRR